MRIGGKLTNEPEKFVGKQISVVGLIDDVCPVRGCWANVKDAEDGSRVRFKVPDGELVFTAKMIGDVLEQRVFFFFAERNAIHSATRALYWSL